METKQTDLIDFDKEFKEELKPTNVDMNNKRKNIAINFFGGNNENDKNAIVDDLFDFGGNSAVNKQESEKKIDITSPIKNPINQQPQVVKPPTNVVSNEPVKEEKKAPVKQQPKDDKFNLLASQNQEIINQNFDNLMKNINLDNVMNNNIINDNHINNTKQVAGSSFGPLIDNNNHSEINNKYIDKLPNINIYSIANFNNAYGLIKTNETSSELEHYKTNFSNNTFFSSSSLKLNSIADLKKQNDFDDEGLTAQIEVDIVDELRSKKDQIIRIKEKLDRYDYSTSTQVAPMSIDTNNFIYRAVLRDGDSYYRAFIFSYIEHIIINKNIYEIKKILFDISQRITQQFIYHDCGINHIEVFAIFKEIINNININQIEEAINILNKGFCVNEHFSNALIKYMKIKLADFISFNSNNFNNQELIDNKLVPESFFHKETKEFLVNEYNIAKILKMQCEPEIFVILITPYAFPNAILSINFIEGNDQKPKYFSIDCLNNHLRSFSSAIVNMSDPKNINVDIELLFSPMKGFSIKYDEKYSTLLPYKGIKENKDKSYIIISEKFFCEKCNREADQVALFKLPEQIFCIDCMRKILKRIISKRIGFFKKEHYQNLEFYLRPISICYDNKFALTDKEIDDILGMPLCEFFVYQMKSTCSLCNDNIDDSTSKELKCGCKMCLNCIGTLISKETNEFVCINAYEKRLQKQHMKCPCGKQFDIDEAVHLLYNEEELKKYQNEANTRIENYIAMICIKCGKRRNDINSIKVQDIQFKSNEEVRVNHVICENCSHDLKLEIKNRKKNNKNETHLSLQCAICNTEHDIAFKAIKSSETACCIII